MRRRSRTTRARSYYKECAQAWEKDEIGDRRPHHSFIGYVCTQMRKDLGFKQMDMGFLGELSQTTISTFERGDIFKTNRTLSALCYAYDIDTRFVRGHTKVPMNYARTKVNESAQAIIRQLLA